MLGLTLLLGFTQFLHSGDLLGLLVFGVGMMFLALSGLWVLERQTAPLTVAPQLRWWLGALFASASVSLLASPMVVAALARSAAYAAVLLVAVLVHRMYMTTPGDATPWLVAILVGATCCVGVAFLQFAAWPPGEQWEHVLPFGNVRRLGTLAFIGGAMSMALMARRPGWQWAMFGMTTAHLFVIVASGSRGALLSWALVVGVMALLEQGRARWRLARLGTGALVLSCVSVHLLHTSGAWKTQNLFIRLADKAGGTVDQVSSGRIELWRASLEEVQRAPLFGRGPDAFLLSECCSNSVIYPHNFGLQWLLEFGAVGLLLGVCFLVSALRAKGGLAELRRAIVVTPDARVLTALLLGMVMHGMMDGLSYWLLPLTLFWATVGLWCASLTEAKEPRLIV